jgi:hypothetical protein
LIVSFGSKSTDKIWDGEKLKRVPLDIQQVGRRKLWIIINTRRIKNGEIIKCASRRDSFRGIFTSTGNNSL